MRVDVAQVPGLVRASRVHLAPSDLHHHFVPVGTGVREPRLLKVEVHPGRAQAFASGRFVKAANDFAGGAYGTGVSAHVEFVAAAVDLDSQTALELAKVLIEGSAQLGQTLVVGRLQRDAAGLRASGFGLSAQG